MKHTNFQKFGDMILTLLELCKTKTFQNWWRKITNPL